MNIKKIRLRIGLRTVKTAAAVVISMIIVNFYGATTSKLIFAMLGAMAAVQPTFTESVESCLTQIVGVIFGAVMGVVLLAFPIHPLVATGIGIILVITLYNTLKIRFSPSLACLIVVTLCTTPGVQPLGYALGRIWDSAIGLSVGMLINTLIFPYDNSRQIRSTVEAIDKEIIEFLEDMFDGDEILPNARKTNRTIQDMERQLNIFSNQKLILHLQRQRNELETFRICERKARELLARMEILSLVQTPGRLNDQNRRRLTELGAVIRDERPLELLQELDVVTNYHVNQILNIRQDLLDALNGQTESA